MDVKTIRTLAIAISIAAVGAAQNANAQSAKHTGAQPYRVGSWAVQAKLDPISDKSWVMVQTPLDSKSSPYLKLSCENGKPYISFGLPGVTLNTDETISVSLRVDKGEVTRSRYLAVGGDLMAARLSQATYQKLVQSHFIAAFIKRDDGNNWTLELPVIKSAEAFKPMLAACPMDTAGTASSETFDPNKLGDAEQTGPTAPTITTRKSVEKIGQWSVLEFKDPVTDDPDIRVVTGDKTHSGAEFAVICQDKYPMMSFYFPRARFAERRLVDALWRINKEPPVATKFSSIANSGEVVAKLLKTTYERLSTATSVSIKINAGTGEAFTTEFHLEKTQDAFSKLLAACPVSSAADPPSQKD